ncbi:hypothetical protein GGX14DRAFT_405868 [Mycena pura]|uniref:Uncharacterized protein n=1 Tax=Mycena pura TaxID=153505 RepID=A0AAD6Y222_9AGAR|nr:hypothetical protein GGX14DRAFT_405868 [Mycena pura]
MACDSTGKHCHVDSCLFPLPQALIVRISGHILHIPTLLVPQDILQGSKLFKWQTGNLTPSRHSLRLVLLQVLASLIKFLDCAPLGPSAVTSGLPWFAPLPLHMHGLLTNGTLKTVTDSAVDCIAMDKRTWRAATLAPGTPVVTLMGGLRRTLNGSYAEYTAARLANVVPVLAAAVVTLGWACLAALPETYATGAAVVLAARMGAVVTGTARKLEPEAGLGAQEVRR